ncbi:hypothetical protein BKA70DRAFT_1221556 [Coprinopsis sp. MPI-PUGE-AT-0042]|nr:hypothetical protein BKA70DRAFT_1221556 [Coprinopsis sp. MPI-PUGE-AT-0042]
MKLSMLTATIVLFFVVYATARPTFSSGNGNQQRPRIAASRGAPKQKSKGGNTPSPKASLPTTPTGVKNDYLINQGFAPGPFFLDHWGLYVGSADSGLLKTGIGECIHVTGDVKEGFKFEVRRNYDRALTSGQRRGYLVGSVPESATDAEPRTAFERALLNGNPPPGPSLAKAGENGGRRGKVQLQNCQAWVRAGVNSAVGAGVLKLSGNAEEVLSRPL